MTHWQECTAVERDPERVSGAWVFRGTRVPVAALFENLKVGATIEEFLEWFPGVEGMHVETVLDLQAIKSYRDTLSMYKSHLSLVLLLSMICFAPISICKAKEPPKDAHLFRSPAAGFSIVKPKDWKFVSKEQVAELRSNVRLSDKEFEAKIRERASAPLVAIMKYDETHDDLNPTVQVVVRPLGKMKEKSPVELMKMSASTLKRSMKDFSLVEKVQATDLKEMPAAYMKAKFTIANPEGREFKVLSRMWMVPRGAFIFVIGMSGTQEGDDVSEEEFLAILNSIEIEK